MVRARIGAIAGIISGTVIAFLAWTLYQTGLLGMNPLVVSADIILPIELAASNTGLFAGALIHLALSGAFGAVFALIIPETGSPLIYGLGYGLLLEIVNSGLFGPILGVMPPITQTSLSTILSGSLVRVVYGLILGYLVGLFLTDKV